MKKNVLGSVLGIALAAVLALGNGMAVRAAEADPSYSFNKVYKLAADCQPGAVSPAETFEFENGEIPGIGSQAKLYAVSHTKYNDSNQPDARTDLNALSTENLNEIPEAVKTITIGNADYEKGVAVAEAGTKRAVAVNVPAADTYKSVGYYYYQFKETTGNTAGVIYAADTYAIRVAVVNDDTTGKLKIGKVALLNVTNNNEKATEVTNEYSAGTLVIKKEVTGNMGDKTKEFTVTVTFTALENKVIKAPINIATSDNNSLNNPPEATITEGNEGTASATIKVKDGTTVTFTNIPKGVTYTVVETSADGYKASYTATSNNGTVDNTTGVSGTISDDNNGDSMAQTVTITNNKGIDIDTGIFVSNLPYLLALAGIAAAALLFFAGKKRHSGED